jgi:hypothetical protein
MPLALVLITAITAAANIAAAIVDFLRAPWILVNMTRYGIPHSWLFSLGVLKAMGGAGLLVGIAVPWVGVAAALGLALYFVGAVVTVVRARWYSHIAFPGAFLLLATTTLALRLAES